MTDERRQRILAIAEELESQGLPATNSSVYARALGHRGHVVTVMKQRRAERVAAGGVAVIEELEDEEPETETTETPAVVLAEDLKQLERAYEGYHAAWEKLLALEHEGVWDEKISQRQDYLQKTMVKNLYAQEALRAALDTARIREAVRSAQTRHDVPIPEAHALAEQALQAVATMHDLFEDLAEVFADQVDGFFPFRTDRGMQAFDVRSGKEYAQELFQAFFAGDPRARDAFQLLMDTHLTMGMLRQALDNCPRLKPFSERAIATYLSQHQTEGTSDGSHP